MAERRGVVEAAVASEFICCISSMSSIPQMRRKLGSGLVMEMTVAADVKRGLRPRRVLRTIAQSETWESLSVTRV
jgi:hypothetical protein